MAPFVAAAALLALSACGGDAGRPPAKPDGPFGNEIGQTLEDVSLPDCGDQMHDLYRYYQQGDGLLVVMTMGVG